MDLFLKLKKFATATALTGMAASLLSACPAAADTLDFTCSYYQLLETKYNIKAAAAGVCARDSERIQAAALPNPIFNVNMNHIGADDECDSNELFVGISQLVELGGKRPARIGIACANRAASEWNVELLKNNLHADLLHAFISMSAAQERLNLACGQQELAKQIVQSVSTKTASGKCAGIDEKKAHVAFNSVKLQYLRQQSQLKKVRQQLISFWDGCPPEFTGVAFPLFQLSCPTDLCLLKASLANNPLMGIAEAESSIACRATALERANAIPDVAFQVGVCTEKFTRDPALYLGFEVPLPIFDRNRGNIERASFEHTQSVYKQLDTANQLETELNAAYEEWSSAYEQAIALKESILPAAEEAFQLAKESYEEGKFDYLDLLDARSTLFNVQQQYLDTVEEYHHKRADILRLTGCFPSY